MVSLNKKFKLIIFDKDGVLIDSIQTCLKAANLTLEHYGMPDIDMCTFKKAFWGMKADTNADVFSNIPMEKRVEMSKYFRKKRDELESEMTKVFPNVKNVLEALKGNYNLAVVTSTERKQALHILNMYGLAEYFDFIVGGDDTEPKPSPKPILLACEKAGVSVDETLFIGDTDADISAGKSAGCVTAIVTTSKAREELERIGGLLIIDDIKEVLELV